MWLEQSEREGGESKEVMGAGHAGSVGPREHVFLYPRGGGSPGGQWTEEGWDLAWVLTSAFWLLQGGQPEG